MGRIRCIDLSELYFIVGLDPELKVWIHGFGFDHPVKVWIQILHIHTFLAAHKVILRG